MTATRIIDDHLELANIGTNSHAQIDTHIAAADDYVKRDGSLALTSDWDIGDTRKIKADEIRARDGDGLKLYDDGGNGIFVKDGGNIGIGTITPLANIHIVEDSYKDVFTMERPTGGFAGKYAFSISGGVFNFKDVTNNRYIFNVDYAAVGGFINLPILTIGKYSAENTEPGYDSLLKGTSAGTTGIDKKGGNLAIASGGGRGNGALSEITFFTPDLAGAGSSEQQYSAKMGIKGNGNVIVNVGNFGLNTTSPTAALDINSDILRLRTAKTPASAGAAGNTGDMGADANYIYRCVSTNSWKRAALNVW